jgi:outer membrane receptor for ferrienterochelin and colicin
MILILKRRKRMNKKIITSIALSAVLASSLFSSDDLGNMIVTAKSKQEIIDTSASYTIISEKDIKGMSSKSLENILEEVVGLSASINSSSISGRKNISLRGTESKHTLILLNGKRISGSDAQIGHSNFQYNWIPLDGIAKIEVIRGPMSSLYGSQAIGGVINIITKKPTKNLEGNIDVSTGKPKGYNGGTEKNLSLRLAGKVTDKLSLSLLAEKKKVDEILSDDNVQETKIEGHEVTNVMLDVAYEIDDSQKVSFNYIIGKEYRTRWGTDNTVLTHYDKYYEIDKKHYSALYQKDFDSFSLDIEAYRTSSDSQANMLDFSKAPFPVSMAGNSNTIHKMEDTVLRAEVTVDSIDNNYVIFGLESRKEDYTKDYISETKTDFSNSAKYKSIFLQDETEIGNDFILTMGSRYDKHDKFGGELSPKIYLVYKLDKNQRIKTGYGHGFNAPTVTQNSDEYSVTASGRKKFFGNDNLKPEISDTIELGYEYNNDNIKFSSTVFHTKIKDMITLDEFSLKQYKYENIDEAKMSGFELEYKQENIISNLDFTFNYAYLKTENETTKKELQAKPKHKINAKLNYKMPYNMDSTFRIKYRGSEITIDDKGTDSIGDDESIKLGGYVTVGIQLTKAFQDNIKVRFGVENLMDKQLSDNYNFDIRGRYYYVGLNYKF